MCQRWQPSPARDFDDRHHHHDDTVEHAASGAE
jgi:hypothetical protein